MNYSLFFGFLLENEKVLEALIAENSEIKTELKDLETPPRYLKKLKLISFKDISCFSCAV